MNKKFQKLSIALSAIAIFSILMGSSCKDKAVVSNPPVPTTAYEGIYKRIINYSAGAAEQIVDSQFVEWKFVESKFYCRAINKEKATPFVCDSYGDYEFTQSGKILLSNISAISPPCSNGEFPGGEFSLTANHYPGEIDSLIMEDLTPNDIFISIKMVRVWSVPI